MENGSYEVEVLLDDGNEVEVHLDASYNVLGLIRTGHSQTTEPGMDVSRGSDRTT